MVSVLLADGSAELRQRYCELLAPLVGWQNIAQTGEVDATVLLLREATPAIVMLDLEMDGGSGFDVLEAVRDALPKPVVIVLSNYDAPEIRALCLREGADYFLDKSNDFERLPTIVAQHIAASCY